ncbi:hypothetical protein U9M48_042303 [Paspalum notatum var. saurae]|uniref:Uncharacterized protein n=1 Tax=Paspalum notatum var. saurae TaxID=547442 RepID=A0AAQ3UWQ7_PASNO
MQLVGFQRTKSGSNPMASNGNNSERTRPKTEVMNIQIRPILMRKEMGETNQQSTIPGLSSKRVTRRTRPLESGPRQKHASSLGRRRPLLRRVLDLGRRVCGEGMCHHEQSFPAQANVLERGRKTELEEIRLACWW